MYNLIDTKLTSFGFGYLYETSSVLFITLFFIEHIPDAPLTNNGGGNPLKVHFFSGNDGKSEK